MRTISFLKVSLILLLLSLQREAMAAPFAEGSDSFNSAAIVPPEGGSSPFTDLFDYTTQFGEPLLFAGGQPKTAWWRWVAPDNGLCMVDTLSTNYGVGDSAQEWSLITVFTGSTLPSLRSVAVSSYYVINDGLGNPGAALSFYAQKGTVYYIQVGSAVVTSSYRKVRLTVSPLVGKPLRLDASLTCIKASGGKEPVGLSVLVNPKGSLSGKLLLKSGTYSLNGSLDSAGYARLSVYEKPKKGEPPQPPILIRLRGVIGGRVMVYMPNCFVAYSDLCDASPVPDVPQGAWSGYIGFGADAPFGSFLMKVKGNAASMAIKTGDGTAFTYAGPFLYGRIYINTVPTIPFMKSAKGGNVALQIYAHVYDGVGLNRLIRSNSVYLRAAQSGAIFYPAGLDTPANIQGYPYLKPLAGQRAHGFLNASGGVGKLRVTDPSGEVGGNVDLPLTFGTDNKFVFGTDTVRKPALKLNVSTGQITGSVILAGKKRSIVGTLSNTTVPILVGHITGTSKNVNFQVIP
jgi:hypothetical protein